MLNSQSIHSRTGAGAPSADANDDGQTAAELAEHIESGESVITPDARPLLQRVLGRPLHTAAAAHQTIGKAVGLAVFASDALSSVAYATEEILLVLAVAGAAFFSLSLPIAGAIAVLLIILTLSYRQTIFAYPSGGGAYLVARDNLGERPAQIAGAALLVDYVLTVAVSIAAGVAQITSAFPALRPFQVELGLVLITLMTLMNLRGVKESGRAFAGPTYVFVGMTFVLLGAGLYQVLTGTLGHVNDVAMVTPVTQPLTLFLVLRAFSSGCTALTGVEAISNGIPAFQEPKSRNASTTMAWMSGTLLVMFLGITALALQVHAVPSEHETVISQLARTVFGNGALYLLMTAATTAILIMAANTSFADFPRLCALQAGDGFLPRQLTFRGQRLVFSWGIVALAGLAALLVVIFQGDTHLLIPLYAIGVFLSFTMSQAGMVIRWHRVSKLAPGEERQTATSTLHHDRRWRVKQALNAVGCALTAVVTVVFAATKFSQGAWVVVILLPVLVLLFFHIHRHYTRVAHSLSLHAHLPDIHAHPVETIVLVNDIHQGTFQMLNFVESLGKPWVAVHVAVRPEKTARVLAKWNTYLGDRGHLYVLPSPYRSLTGPVVRLISDVKHEHPDAFINIITSQLVTQTLWGRILHRNSATLFRFALQRLQGVAVTDVHYRIREELPTDEPPTFV